MGLLDIFKKGKKGKAEQKISKRPSKGVFKQPSYVKGKAPSFAKASGASWRASWRARKRSRQFRKKLLN